MTDYIGQTFGNYRLLRLVGQGSFADVYLGRHIYLKTEAAIKILSGRLDAEAVEAFLKEAHLLQNIEHPHIMHVYDVSISENVPYLVMDYAAGGTLRERHPKGTTVPLPTIVTYIKQVAQALDYAHEQKLIHRDLKPENLLLNQAGSVLLGDFGVALPMRHTESMSDQPLRGTLSYMAPEQIRGQPRGGSDQYALGVIVYEWVCGQRPFAGGAAELLGQHLFVPPPSLRVKIPELPEPVEQVIFKALAKDYKQRFACTEDFAQALEEASKGKIFSISFDPVQTPAPGTGEASTSQPAPGKKRINNLPARLTHLIGRASEREAACVMLVQPEVRLLTMTGPGGIGKTSLALAVAADAQAAFLDGVCYVPLATISHPDQVLPTIFQALEFKEGNEPTAARLASLLVGQRLLLVLDNFEQVIDAAPVVLDLLERCPELTLLITSRTVLHILGEHTFPVPPLQNPDLRKAQETYAHSPAVQLFCKRAAEHKASFHLTDANTRAVAEICSHLDGLPLAIELAAARIQTMPPHHLLTRLKRRLDLLSSTNRALPERQQTIRRTIQWSYDLLQPADQVLLQRLAVFVGGCRMRDIEALYEQLQEGSFTLIDSCAHLLDSSLIYDAVPERDEPRLRLLEIVREFALEQLTARGEREMAQQAHAAYYFSLMPEDATSTFILPESEWTQFVLGEFENIAAALDYWYESEQFKQAILLTAGMSCLATHSRFYHWYLDAITHALSVYQRVEGEILPLCKASLLVNRGFVCSFLWVPEIALSALKEALPLLRPVVSTPLLPVALHVLFLTSFEMGDFAQAEQAIEEAEQWTQMTGIRAPLARTLVCKQLPDFYRGNFHQAAQTLQEALAVCQEMEEIWAEAATQMYIGWIAYHQKAYQAASQTLEKSVTLFRALHFPPNGLEALSALASTYLALGETRQARQLFEEARTRSLEEGEIVEEARALWGLARLELLEGDHARAAGLFETSIARMQRLATIPTRCKHLPACALEGLAQLAMQEKQMAWAACLLGAADAQRKKGRYDPICLDAVARDRVEAEARFVLGEQGFTQALAVGQRMTPEQALAAREKVPTDSTPMAAVKGLDPMQIVHSAGYGSGEATLSASPGEHLTKREMDVLCLLAEGRTNAEIAEHLVLSVVTVNSYLRSIYGKLGVSSRTRAVRVAQEQKLLV
ncbi:MAG TPA: protein kinase [Ktedonosporobacter sp.]|nr:protein kinase [Ktedonosporobacter sp.]